MDGTKVFCLDTTTNTRILVTELPFEPICTASGFGWFCAGGEKSGYFAAIRIPDNVTHEGIIDEQHPNDQQRSLMLDHLEALYTGLPPPIRVERLGSQILNSISLHLLHGTGPEEVEDEVVAVLTNNDMTVRIYSLTRDKEIMKEKFEFPMNHATISPDGKLLIIVGDREIAYFYKRFDGQSQITEGINGRGLFQNKKWLPLREIELHKPPHKVASAYFTSAWSPNGRLCATASEDGFITLFDANLIHNVDQDPFYAMISSSRPDSVFGGICTMYFAPDPWDLLVWNEDRGRMCMADVRHGLNVRQVSCLDPHISTVKHADLLEATLHISDNHGLTEQELQILDGIRTTRQRQDASGEARPTPRSINYIPPRNRQRMTDSAFLSTFREYFRDQNWDAAESTDRRTNSVSRHTGSPSSRSARSSLQRPTNLFSDHPNDPWRVIEAAMQHGGPTAETPVTVFTPTVTTYNEVSTPVTDEDDVALPPLISANDPPSPRTRAAQPHQHEATDLLASERRSDRHHNRTLLADYRNDVSLREHIAELEAEVDATERQLLRGNNSATPLPPPDTGPSERELLERRRRLLAIAAVSEEVGAERRRRSMREPRSTIMTGGTPPPPITGFSPRRDRDGSLTTRGAAVLERQRLQREATEREREQPPENEREDNADRSSVLRAFYDRSMQDFRRAEITAHDRRRWSRLNELSVRGDSGVAGVSPNPDAGLRTTGIAWGDGKTL